MVRPIDMKQLEAEQNYFEELVKDLTFAENLIRNGWSAKGLFDITQTPLQDQRVLFSKTLMEK